MHHIRFAPNENSFAVAIIGGENMNVLKNHHTHLT
jgi:hypothetical protein